MPLLSAVALTVLLSQEALTLILAPGLLWPHTRAEVCCWSTIPSLQGSFTLRRAAAETQMRAAAREMSNLFIVCKSYIPRSFERLSRQSPTPAAFRPSSENLKRVSELTLEREYLFTAVLIGSIR